MILFKVQIKLKIDDHNNEWVHFCYVPMQIKSRFDRCVNTSDSNYWIETWARFDFGMESVDTYETFNELKRKVKDKYKEQYPDLYVESPTDRSGWLRVWLTKHMERELSKYGRY